MKLVSISKASDGKHKFVATFENPAKTVKFGAAGMDDYTLTKNEKQRELYRTRHAKDLETKDPSKPGYLSYYLLWGESSNLNQNIALYKKHFNL